MNIDERINDLRNLRRRSSLRQWLAVAGGLLLYIALFLAAFDNHSLLAVCVTLCIAVGSRSLLRARDFRVEERVLSDIRRELAK